MCNVCHHTSCDPRCPNADPPRPVLRCDRCGEGIYSGEAYYLLGGPTYHRACLDAEFLLELYGVRVRRAD